MIDQAMIRIARRLLSMVLQRTGGFHPESLILDLTHLCNSACGGCGFREPEEQELSVEQWLALAKEGKQLGFKELVLTGGEPLAHPHISSLLPVFAQLFPISLISNGLLLSRYAPLLLQSQPKLYISLDAHTADAYQKIRGVPGFHTMLKGVKFLKGKLYQHARVTVWADNVASLYAIANCAQEAGFDALSILAADTTSSGFGNRAELGLAPVQAAQLPVLAAQLRLLKKHPLLKQSQASLQKVYQHAAGFHKAPFCMAPWTSGMITSARHWHHCFFLESSASTSSGLKKAIQQAASERRFQTSRHPVCQRCVCWRG
jgi:MoaA/NifB/PqqE/SkfB family radical SAM enzyme